MLENMRCRLCFTTDDLIDTSTWKNAKLTNCNTFRNFFLQIEFVIIVTKTVFNFFFWMFSKLFLV